MPVKDIFDKPFDEGTKAKLEIFEKYFDEWLPTFIMGNFVNPIQVFDLFAGNGYDINGVPGSPIRVLEIINKHRRNLVHKQKKVYLFFNDNDNDKIEQLKSNVDQKVKELSLKSMVVIEFFSKDFRSCILNNLKKELDNGCNLIFIDQNGFKEVDEQIFQLLIKLDTTEFIFFISSTFIHRFAKRDEVKKYHPKFDSNKIKDAPRRQIHNIICEEFSKYVPTNLKSYLLIPFSLMKDDHINIYGLIFVCKHPRAADKFLHIVWKKNALNGNANYDIDEDISKAQTHLFDAPKLTKIEYFQSLLKDKLLNGLINNNNSAYYYALNEGHIPNHAAELLKVMKKEKVITFDSPSPLVNYEQVVKLKRILEYKLLPK